jgi:uncharacterized protein YndB with AHSA1/START domain
MTSRTSSEQTTPGSADATTLRQVVSVNVPAAVAWQVFTEKMGTWWPLSTHKIGEAKAIDAVIEPVVGGRWYERGDDGSSCDWGRVLAWEPHTRLVLSWEITADWKHDPTLQTEVEVRFIAEGNDATRVELEHRHLDRYGERRCQMRAIFDSAGGWSGLLESFAQLAASEAR